MLVEGGDRVLPTYPAELSERAHRQLERLGVDVRTGCRVTGIDADELSIGATRVAAKTALWAAGVAASALGRDLPAQHDAAGRVAVRADLSLADFPEVSGRAVALTRAATCRERPAVRVAPPVPNIHAGQRTPGQESRSD